MANPYTLLGVSKTASHDEIKQAYRKLARKMHPDLNQDDPQAEDKFKEISSAYDILSDENKRRRFDTGEIDENGKERAGFGYSSRNPYGAYQSAGNGFEGFNFDFRNTNSSKRKSGFDFFSDMFSSGASSDDVFANLKRRSRKSDGENTTYEINVSFLDAALGKEKEITLPNGKTLNIKIPSGSTNDTTLRLKGQGEKGILGGANGDALVKLSVQPHAYFTRNDLDILLDVPITLKEAILGEKVNIPTLESKVALSIPAYSTSGAVLRLKGKGIKTTQKTGDLLVKLLIMLPEKPDSELTEIIKDWKSAEFNPRQKAGLN